MPEKAFLSLIDELEFLKQAEKEAQEIVETARKDAELRLRKTEESAVASVTHVEKTVHEQSDKIRELSKQKLALEVKTLETEFSNERNALKEKAEKNWKKYSEEGNLIMTITYRNNVEQRINGIKIRLPESDVTLIR